MKKLFENFYEYPLFRVIFAVLCSSCTKTENLNKTIQKCPYFDKGIVFTMSVFYRIILIFPLLAFPFSSKQSFSLIFE